MTVAIFRIYFDLILPNISISKNNQTMKLGQLIEYKMRNIFLEKRYTKCTKKLLPEPFLKNQNWVCLWINSLKFCAVCFYCIWLICRPLAFTSHKAFWKTIRDMELVSLPHIKWVTREGTGGGLPSPFSEIGKSALILGKNTLIVVIYGLNFSFKVQFLGVSRRKNWRFFPAGPLFFVV